MDLEDWIMVTFTDELSKEYEELWSACKIDRDKSGASNAASRLITNKSRYKKVEDLTGVPWYWVAIVHNREDNGNFSGVLHNGEHIIGKGTVTTLVPAGRGPFSSWVESAVDALEIKGLVNKSIDWTVGRFWYECERFNGFGYRNKGLPSPYLWSHTNNYEGGKYVRDHVYDSSVYDQQFGAAAVLQAMIEQDSSIKLGQKPVTGEVKFSPGLFAAIAAVIGGVVYYLFKRKRKAKKHVKLVNKPIQKDLGKDS